MNRWISNVAAVLLVVLGSACGDATEPSPDVDTTDSFATDGKADGLIPDDDAPQACAILKVANEAPFEVLDSSAYVGLDVRAATNIVTHRKKEAIDSLEELDSIPWVGQRAFGKLHFFVTAKQTDEWRCDRVDCPDGTTADGERCVPADCSYESLFAARYGQPFRPDDIGFLTADGTVARGVDALNLDASRNAVRLRVNGNASDVVEMRLHSSNGDEVLATRREPYIYGLGHAAWREVNDMSSTVEHAALVQLAMEEPTHAELVTDLELLLQVAADEVPAADRDAFDSYRADLMDDVESGRLDFRVGHGHAIRFNESRRTTDGRTFAIQYSNSFGLRPIIGFRRSAAWGDRWASIPLEPECEGVTE